MCSSSVRIVLFACAFGVITILLTLSIISGLYLFVVSWSGVCQDTPESCQKVAKECTIAKGCDYLVASTAILSVQSGLIIICFYSLVCFLATLKRNTSTVFDRESTPELPTPFIMAGAPPTPTTTASIPHVLPGYQEATSDRECLIRRQPPEYNDIN